LIFGPLGLDRSCFLVQDVLGYPFAVGHRTDEHGHVGVVRDFALPRSVHPAGGVWATIDDLLDFAAFHLGLRPVAAPPISWDSITMMQAPQVAAANWADWYGLGWAIWSIGSVRVIGHGGSTNGYQAHLVLLPEERVAIASLTNHEQGSSAYLEVETWILTERFGIRPPAPRLCTVSERELQRYAGTYTYPLARLTVRAVTGGLWLEAVQTRGLSREARERPLPPLFLRPIGERVFATGPVRAVPNRVDFIFDGDSEHPRWVRAFGRLAERDAIQEY
jgi:CubicO group peptidase (beta-lactamase class C family)